MSKVENVYIEISVAVSRKSTESTLSPWKPCRIIYIRVNFFSCKMLFFSQNFWNDYENRYCFD